MNVMFRVGSGLGMTGRVSSILGTFVAPATASGSVGSVGCMWRVQQRTKFTTPGSYVFGKVYKPARPKNRVVRVMTKKHDKTAPVADMEPYNRETKKYDVRRLMKLDPEDRMRDSLAQMKAKKEAEAEQALELAMTPPPRQQIGQVRNFANSPRKVNSFARLIRKMPVVKAMEQLQFVDHIKASRVVLMCLRTAVRNARNNQGIEADNLWVAHAYTGKATGNRKSLDIKGRGRFGTIIHRKSHFFLVLEEGPAPIKHSKFIPKNLITRWVHDRPAPFIQAAS